MNFNNVSIVTKSVTNSIILSHNKLKLLITMCLTLIVATVTSFKQYLAKYYYYYCCFVSFSVSFMHDFNNKTIYYHCSSSSLDPLPPPMDVQLSDITPNVLTFNWSTVLPDCSSLRYTIDSDCGMCTINQTSTENSSSATCLFERPISIMDNFCNFSVRSVVCSNITGSLSVPLKVNLKCKLIDSQQYTITK